MGGRLESVPDIIKVGMKNLHFTRLDVEPMKRGQLSL